MSGLTTTGVPESQPVWLLWVKFAIIGLSVVELALAAWAVSLCDGYAFCFTSSVGGFEIFLVIKTWIIYGLILFAELQAQHMFYRLVIIIASAISIVFWLSGWAWAASWASATSVIGYPNSVNGAMAGCAAVGAIIWILCIVHLVFFVMACNRSPPAMAPMGINHAELGNVQKPGAAVYEQPAPYGQQPQPYQQQPYQQQPAYTQ